MEDELFERIVTFENLLLAAKKAYKGKKDKYQVARFYFNLEKEIILLREELLTKTYKPLGYSIFKIYEPKERNICSADFRDRVIHHAIINIIGEKIEKRLIYDTYACRKNKGTHKAIERVQNFSEKYKYFLKCDIRKYFESIDCYIMINILIKMFPNNVDLLSLVISIVNHRPSYVEEGKGLPIGNLTSQHFANLYLGELDHYIKDKIGIKGYVRYMDDFIVFYNDKKELQKLLIVIERFCNDKLKLELKSSVTKIAPVSEGIPFLGHRIFPNLVRIRRENLVRSKRKIKKRETDYLNGNITEEVFVNSVKSILAHISHGNTLKLRRKMFYNIG